ncbi:unnamed protein product, partial [Mesorhabditis belari]|uniref:General transcription factor IIH subunit n=1 Tax=Mesorhabditis belari TaxID=2138241 RepID=A0AAF3J3Z6_9BILA
MALNGEEEEKGYTWEADYAEGLNIRGVLEEDEKGSIEKSIQKVIEEARRKAHDTDRPSKCRLGIMRYLYIVVDCSRFMQDKSLMPSRLAATIKIVTQFLDKFFELNPIAQVGLIVCKDRKAERIVPLTGNVRQLVTALTSINELQCMGDFSLQNALRLALTNLKDLPKHFSREVLVIMSSLTSVDPGNIFSTIENVQASAVRCSVIGLAAELFVCSQLAKLTKGKYSVVLDSSHFELEINSHATPPSTGKTLQCNAVEVGFPKHESVEREISCLCHSSGPISKRGYECPRCGGRYCSIPVECRVCRLTLVAAPQLARAFRHLLPLPPFRRIDANTEASCFACHRKFAASSSAFECKQCAERFCIDCDIFLHESLYICPGCKTDL